jgi:hypothetical protein
MPRLICSQVRFYSPADEAGFFAALGAVKAIRKIQGCGDSLVVSVPARLSESSLRDLIGIFHRYRIEMGQLGQFRNDTNEGWFYDREAFWFRSVFGRRSGTGAASES